MRGHPVSGNKTCRTPRAHIVFECATWTARGADADTETERFRLACAHSWRCEHGRNYSPASIDAGDENELWTWIVGRLRPGVTTWIWSRNLIQQLTISGFWQRWQTGMFSPKWYALDGRCTILAGRIQGKSVRIVDIQNWLPAPLSELGEWIGLPQLLTPTPVASDEAVRLHCERDVQIMSVAVQQICALVRKRDLGCMRYTASGQAFRHWQHIGSPEAVIPPNHPKECALARAAYYGGRTEVFGTGLVNGPVYIVDCNGMYGAAMLRSMQPRKLVDYSDRCGDGIPPPGYPGLGAIAEVLLDSDTSYPVRDGDGTMTYPVGRHWTTLAGAELERALTFGHVQEVRRCAVYQLAPVCHEFVRRWWQWRTEYARAGDTVLSALCKAMPCYLYGRWGQLASAWEPAGNDSFGPPFAVAPHWDAQTKQWHPGRTIASRSEIDRAHVYRVDHSGLATRTVCRKNWRFDLETPTSFPAIAAFTTAQARVIMDDYRAIAGAENVYYQCVDALHVSQEGYDRLLAAGAIDPDRMGALKLKRVADRVEYYGPNCLRVDGVLCAAGLPGRHVVAPDGTIRAQTVEGLQSILRRGPDGTVRVTTHDWTPGAKNKSE